MSALPPLLRRLRLTLEMVRFSHTLFALPFAAASALAAARGLPNSRQALGLLGAMVGARSAAMAFNRLADARLDALNPRTAGRHLPAGLLGRGYVAGFVLASAALFVASAAALNRFCLLASPVVLLWLMAYSYAKRLTEASHLWLGTALGLAPVGAWVAIRGGAAEAAPWCLFGAVTCWTAGFDLIYACQDADVDRRLALRAVPARRGIPAALALARWLHVAAVAGLLAFVRAAGLGRWSLAAVAAAAALMAWEHRLVRPGDLGRVERAFFTANALVSAAVLLGVAADVLPG